MGLSIELANALKENERLWKSFVASRFRLGTLIELRDLPIGVMNIDTLYVLTTQEHVDELIQIVVDAEQPNQIGYLSEIDGKLEWSHNPGFSINDFFEFYGSSKLEKDEVLARFWWD